MHSNNKTKIEELNTLIDEVDTLQSDYNDMITPIVKIRLELKRHQSFFAKAKTTDEENKEAKILESLETKLKEFDSSGKNHTCEILKSKIDAAKEKLEKLWIQIEGRCDRSSPHFLEKIRINQ